MPKRKYVPMQQKQYKYFEPQDTTPVVKVFDYLIGIVVFGFVWFILNDPMNVFHSAFSSVSNGAWVQYLWSGSLIIYLIFGAFYFLSNIRDKDPWR